jgi:hypothetical protein
MATTPLKVDSYGYFTMEKEKSKGRDTFASRPRMFKL